MRFDYHEERTDRFGVGIIYLLKTIIDKERLREHNEDIREALRCKSGSEFLREIK